MPQQINDLLAPMYVSWLRTQGLERGSAEEVLAREGLTEHQTKWLHAFTDLWELSGDTVATPPPASATDNKPGFVDAATAFQIVLDLARRGICDAASDRAKHIEQATAVNVIEDIAVNQYGDDGDEEEDDAEVLATNQLIAIIWPILDAGVRPEVIEAIYRNVMESWEPNTDALIQDGNVEAVQKRLDEAMDS